MKKLLLSLLLTLVLAVVANAQEVAKSRIILKNNDTITGKIIEMRPGEYVKIEVVGNNIITIPYSEIKNIYLDESEAVTSAPNVAPSRKEQKPLKKFYFETHNEIVLGLGIGKVYNLPVSLGTVLNDSQFGGFYTANGVGYRQQFFVGIGIGYNKYSTKESYAMPAMLDLRFRVFRDKKLSPIAMFAAGAEYRNAGLGTFTFSDGLGLSILFKERFNANLLLTHTMVRYMPNLSIENGPLEDALGNSYYNYIGLRLGVSFKI